MAVGVLRCRVKICEDMVVITMDSAGRDDENVLTMIGMNVMAAYGRVRATYNCFGFGFEVFSLASTQQGNAIMMWLQTFDDRDSSADVALSHEPIIDGF